MSVNLELSEYQARVVLIALETMRNRYRNDKTYLGKMTHDSFAEAFEQIKAKCPEGILK